ncbi:MAG TPA: pirin family protein [bacterium]|nr:pirin family protein [bacterium]
MLKTRLSQERGQADHGWLKSFYTFSFADYQDPGFNGFRALRVINEDRVEPGQGFGRHPHDNMEILSYVLEGSLEHKDSMGTGSVLKPGDVQVMSAGTGVAHSEFNPSWLEPVHFLQIWMFPDARNLKPRYDQKHFPEGDKKDRLLLIASKSGREGSVVIHQDIELYASKLSAGKKLEAPLREGSGFWLQLVEGQLSVQGQILSSGDALYGEGEKALEIKAGRDSHFLLFDLGPFHRPARA